MTNVRFMQNNFLSNSFTYSSQLSSFPATNAFNTSRSKIWKPGGNFEITTSNNKLYINDGSDKTVSLTVGAYTYSTLASHIQTQLNASSSNWTCTYDNVSMYKFTINRTSGTAVLRQSQTTDAVWDTLGYTGTTDISSPPFVADEQRNHTSEWVQCDLGVPQLATFAGILSGIDKIFTLSASAVIKARANNIDRWVAPPVDITIPVGEIAAMAFLDDVNTATYRFHRIEIIDRKNFRGPEGLEFAFIYLGDHITIADTNFARGFQKILIDPSTKLQSENGAIFTEKRPRYTGIRNSGIQLINGTERKTIEQLFYDVGQREPMFVSIDPGTSVSLSLEELTRFMICTNDLQMEHVLRDYYNINFEMREAF